jgi:hypothetical protein
MSKSAIEIVSEMSRSKSWCLCLFFSVDIEGATRYKSVKQLQHGHDDWCTVFESFYIRFPKDFTQSYIPLPQSVSDVSDTCTTPAIWKYVGDEILFYVPLNNSQHVLTHVSNFGQTLIDYDKLLQAQGLHCKGTMWLAGFPINNRVVVIPDISESNNKLIDFIGSSIDCGFRLSKFSSPRRLVLSLDLIWMLSTVLQKSTRAKQYDWFVFRYHGEHELKGVFSGRKYPIFGLDLYANDTLEEDKWNQIPPKCEDKDAIIKFCEKVHDKMNEHDFIRPFIANDKSSLFSEIPLRFKEQQELLKNYDNTNTAPTSKVAVETIQNYQQEIDKIDLSNDSLAIDTFKLNSE